MNSIIDKITQAICDFLISLIEGSLSTMFNDVNEKVATIAADVGQTPQGWNASIFSLIQNISQTVILPIAGLIIAFVLCYELITMITEKNNMHDIDTFMFFKYFLKAGVAIYIVTHTFDITMAVFDVAQHIVTNSAGVIGANTNIDISSALADIRTTLEAMGMGELFLLVLETSLVSLCMKILSVCITVVIFGRMIEIYLYCSVGAIPFATMTNREWGQMGNNYLRGLVALGFQGFFIMVCVGIYAALVNGFVVTNNLHTTIFTIAAYTVVLCFSLFKTGNLYLTHIKNKKMKGGIFIPYVPVPKDLTTVKTKVAFNLTKRQLICFGLAAAVAVPTYFLTRGALGTTGAVMTLVIAALPFFFLAMYEKDGQPAEKILRNYIRSRFLTPRVRPYKTNNMYSAIMNQIKLDKEVKIIAEAEYKHKTKTKEKAHNISE